MSDRDRYFMFVFFKQKTAYEMRISDWSSDVCSSDLDGEEGAGERTAGVRHLPRPPDPRARPRRQDRQDEARPPWRQPPGEEPRHRQGRDHQPEPRLHGRYRDAAKSEEHKSELQSLMRISYTAICLKTKKHTRI